MDLDHTSEHGAWAAHWLRIDVIFTSDHRLARLDVAGELDGSAADELLGAVRQVLRPTAPEQIELDVAGLTFVDSAGIRCLLTCRAAAHDVGSRLLLVNPTAQVSQTLDVTGLLGLFVVAEPAGPEIQGRLLAGTGAGRGPHQAQPAPELFAQSAALRQTARETCARAVAARHRHFRPGPETVAG